LPLLIFHCLFSHFHYWWLLLTSFSLLAIIEALFISFH
jgi:hypothetical protein